MWFYDDSILSGTKTNRRKLIKEYVFYDDSILSGTKTLCGISCTSCTFYDDSILSGTKTNGFNICICVSFMMTQFFQVLKHQIPLFT